MSEDVQSIKVPKGVEKYKEIDLKLLHGEKSCQNFRWRFRRWSAGIAPKQYMSP